MNLTQHIKLHNRFDVEVSDAKTGAIRQKAYAENIVLNALWNRIMVDAYFTNIQFGSGTGTMDATRTSLFTFIGTKQSSGTKYAFSRDEGWMSVRRSIQLLEYEYIGQTLREVGIAYGSSSSNLVTHALLKDMNGNQVSITKTNVDVITIYATVYVRIPSDGWSNGKIQILPSPTPKDYGVFSSTIRWLFGLSGPLAGENTKFYFLSANPICMVNKSVESEILAIAKSSPVKTVDAANKSITYSTIISSAEGNSGTVKGFWSVAFGMGSSSYSITSEPFATIWFDLRNSSIFTGSTILSEILGTGDGLKKDYKTLYPFPRSGAVVKVDGITVSVVAVDSDKLPSTLLDRHMIVIDRSSCAVYGYGVGLSLADIGSSGHWIILENPYYSQYGIASLHVVYNQIQVSDDCVNWTVIREGSTSIATVSIAEENRNKRYWKIVSTMTNTFESPRFETLTATGLSDLNNIHLETPPGLVSNEAIGSGDGSQTTFNLQHTPISGSLVVNIDGVPMSDYTVDGLSLQFIAAPGLGSIITADYRYECAISIDYETPVVAKDSNLIYDFSFTIQFGEWTPN